MGNDQRFPSPPYYVSKECKLIPEAVDKELTWAVLKYDVIARGLIWD